MAENVKLFTQSELTALNIQLDQLSQNLSAHVNGSLSKVHGLNVIPVPYYDSAGDRLGEMTVSFQFGDPPNNVTLFAPARVLTSANDPGPHSTSDGGIGGTSAAAGVPIQSKPLVTSSPSSDAIAQASVYNQLLLLHSNSTIDDIRENQAHGGTAYATENVLDSLGHTVGRNTITLGINGKAVKIPADPNFLTGLGYGPPEPLRKPSLRMNPADASFSYNSSKNYYQHEQFRGGGTSFGDLYPNGQSFSATIVSPGETPLFKWYYYNTTLADQIPPLTSTSNWFLLSTSLSAHYIGYSYFELYATSGVLRIGLTMTNENYADISTWFKCVITNSVSTVIIALRYRTHE